MARFGSFFDGVMSIQERACLASFIARGHSVSIFSYDRMSLPEGVTWLDAATVLPRSDFYRVASGPHRGSCSQFSDRFRYHMIRRTGLAWIDTDVFCLRPDWPDGPILIGAQERNMVNGAVLGLTPDHAALDDAITVVDRLGAIAIWGLTGPHLLTALVHEHGLAGSVLPASAFYPIHFSKAALLLQPAEADFAWPADCCCVHLWNEALRGAGYDRAAGPPPGSILHQLFESLGPALNP